MFKKLFKLLAIVFFLGISFYNYSKCQINEHLIQKVTFIHKKSGLDCEKKKLSYALGSSLGSYMKNFFKEQENLGIYMDSSKIALGFQDAINGLSKLSHKEISKLLQKLENRLKVVSKMVLRNESQENIKQGKIYARNFLKKKGAKQTKSGLIYLIRYKGNEKVLLKSGNSIYTVHYKGTLINGTEFDSSYSRGEPFSFTLDNVIPAWQEGIQLIDKKGKIKLIVPPKLAYGNTIFSRIPINSTLIFDIELLDIKNIS